ncbi:hypothetical protein EON64_13680 [archaeon]|nr:MAG: hypothetical protein EON64_13680 [archaeon]
MKGSADLDGKATSGAASSANKFRLLGDLPALGGARQGRGDPSLERDVQVVLSLEVPRADSKAMGFMNRADSKTTIEREGSRTDPSIPKVRCSSSLYPINYQAY